jgi:valyl-tRNA synthetase
MSTTDSIYNPKEFEPKISEFWEKNKFFHADENSKKTPYTIILPPPNVTSQLHMGHGLGYSIQDTFIRWKRMQGYNACWLPGTDHAGIATQMMVEQHLKTQGKTRTELGREKFFQMCLDWQTKYGQIILDQCKKMGFSFDMDRCANTMDPNLSAAVRHVFVTLFEEGLIYRGERLVNWDCHLQTAVSDDEVVNQEVNGNLWYFRYPIVGTNDFIPIATTRPETMLGDSAVAVHPEGKFKHLVGKSVKLPFTDRIVPIIGDDYVKEEFGTGAVKITPAHDPNDFEIGKRHNLKLITVMDDSGKMKDVPQRFLGLDRFDARKEVLKALKELELFDEVKPHKATLPYSDRSKTLIEPKLSKQWFVKMAGMAKAGADVARNDKLKFYPDNWKKTYLHWLDNIQDWCISRQLWWGHQIPIWYCKSCQEVTTGMTDPTQCKSCGSKELKQDEDVLDTWFSSWLWPLSPFGWPNNDPQTQQNLKTFYPSQVLVTAPEIIFLWVARMVMVGLKFKGEVPYHDVYLTATVCDKKGRKFSKTLGNGIDPLELIDKHGADAARFTSLNLAPLGSRVMMETEDFEAGARYINKIWNAYRFLTQYIGKVDKLKPIAQLDLATHEKWLISQSHVTANKINQLLTEYRLNEAVEVIYHHIWGTLCDWGIECAKEDLNDDATRLRAVSVLVYNFELALRLAHPIIPFITEEIWQKLPASPDLDRPKSIAIAAFPDAKKIPFFESEFQNWNKVKDVITGIRSVRTQSNIAPKEKLNAYIKTAPQYKDVFLGSAAAIKKLAKIEDLVIDIQLVRPPKSLTYVGADFEIFIPVQGIMDVEKEEKRLASSLEKITQALEGINKKLGNEAFVSKAPEEILVETRAKQAAYEAQKQSIEINLKALRG